MSDIFKRYAVVYSDRIEEIRRYLPSNYRATHSVRGRTYIEGQDVAGWTLDGYVIPRLASGLFSCREGIDPNEDDLEARTEQERALISDAAEATEYFDEDELEAHAETLRARTSRREREADELRLHLRAQHRDIRIVLAGLRRAALEGLHAGAHGRAAS